jgi:O-antigen/teichoic acid export membrane protein
MVTATTTNAVAAAQRLPPPRSLRNVLTSWGAFAFSVGVNFFLSPYVVHTLGNTAYGVWVLLGSLVGYMGLLDLGVRSAVMRYVARHHARVEDAEAGTVTSSAVVIFSIAGLIAITASVVIAVLLDRLFQVPPELLGVARVVVILGGLNVAVALVSGVFGGVVAALQRFDLNSILEIGIGAIRAVVIVLALGAGWGLLALSLIQLACTVARAAAQYGMVRRLYPELRYRFQGLRRDEVRKIFSFSIYSSLLHISGALIFSADSVVIGAFLPVATIAFFAIGATLTDYTRTVISSISQTITPRASALDGVGAGGELARVLLKAGAVASLVVLPITITFLVRGPSFIGLWMGPAYAGPSGQVLRVLAAALMLAAARQVVMSSMIGLNQHRQLVPFYILEGVLNLGLSVYWIRSWGILGVALGTAIPNVVTTVLIVPWVVQRVLRLPIATTATELWIRPLLAMVPFAAATLAVERLWPAHGLIEFFAGVAVALPAALLGAWFIAFSSPERRAYAAAITARFRATRWRTAGAPDHP